jgi:hypothetical protein
MPDSAPARAAVLDLLSLLTGVQGRLAAAPVRRGMPDRLAGWRAVLTDKSADAFPRQLAHKLRAARAAVAPVRDALRAARGGGLYPAESAPIAAAIATEYVMLIAAEVLNRMDGKCPVDRWPDVVPMPPARSGCLPSCRHLQEFASLRCSARLLPAADATV